MEDKINLFLEELEKQGIQIDGETAFLCNDGILLVSPNDNGGVDLMLVRNIVKIDYDLGVTDKDVELFNTVAGIAEELGGEDGGDR